MSQEHSKLLNRAETDVGMSHHQGIEDNRFALYF